MNQKLRRAVRNKRARAAGAVERDDEPDWSGTPEKSSLARGTNLTFSIVQDLGATIVSGRLRPGRDSLIEEELCQRYGASRSVVREAVKMLTAKGLVGARPRQGTWIEPERRWNLLDPDVLRWLLERKFSPALLVEFSQVRLAIEPEAASLAARYASAGQKAAIDHALSRMKAASLGHDDPLDSDIAFHVAVLNASGNRFYMQLRELIATALGFSIRRTNAYKGVKLASIEDHAAVLDAINKGAPRRAETAMRALIQEAMDLLQR